MTYHTMAILMRSSHLHGHSLLQVFSSGIFCTAMLLFT